MGMRIDVVEGGKIAVLALRANRLRTLLTTVGIGIGVCTLLAIVGIIQGLNASFAQQLSSLGGDLDVRDQVPVDHARGLLQVPQPAASSPRRWRSSCASCPRWRPSRR